MLVGYIAGYAYLVASIILVHNTFQGPVSYTCPEYFLPSISPSFPTTQDGAILYEGRDCAPERTSPTWDS